MEWKRNENGILASYFWNLSIGILRSFYQLHLEPFHQIPFHSLEFHFPFENADLYPKGLCKAEPYGFHFDSFHLIVVCEGYSTLSKSQLSGGLFEILKMFYPPKGLCDSRVPKEVQLFFIYDLFRLGNVY